MSRSRKATKSWATAYQTEQRQPHGVHGGGQWTRGNINPASAAAARNAQAIARNRAIVAGTSSGGGGAAAGGRGETGPDAEDQSQAGQARTLESEAAQIEQRIDHLQAELKAVSAELKWRAANPPGASSGTRQSNTAAVSQQAKPGSAAGASTRSSTSPYAGVSTASLQSRKTDLRTDIRQLKKQRASLLSRARALLRASQKSARPSTTKGNRVAVIAPEASKAATLTGDGEVTFASIPIAKMEETPDGDVIVYGKASDGSVDSDEQIVDPDFSAKALQDWLDTAGNVRVQHQAQRDPAGRGLAVEVTADGHWVKSLVVEPVAKELVRKGVLTAYSVGIAHPTIVRDAVARGGRITNGQIVELSLVDRPANKNCGIQLVKMADDGTPEFTGKVFGADGVLTKDAQASVTLDLPADVSVSFSPADLAKLVAHRRQAEERQAGLLTKAAVVTPGGDPVATVPVAEKRDFDANVGGGVDRDKLPASDFAGRNRSFPIVTQADVTDALQSIGRAGEDNYDAATLRRNILRIARRKGFKVPKSDRKASKAVATAARTLAKAAEPDVTKCGPCGGTGMADGKPCGNCKKGRKLAARMAERAQKAALAQRRAEVAATVRTLIAEAAAAKKDKVLCPHCGARQNAAHRHCPECGKRLPASALPVEKNHDFTCLNCGKALDKGEKHCPHCGKENPGYLPEADRKIPANEDAGKAAKGGKKTGGKNPFGGKQAPPFGAAKDGDDDEDGTSKGAGKGRVDKAKKRKTPGDGVVGARTKPVPRHREPDGAEVEAFEDDAGLQDGDHEAPTHLEARTLKGGDPELNAAMRLKSLNVPLPLGQLHDLTCPAYAPADVAKAYPGASLAAVDLADFQAQAIGSAATAAYTDARKSMGVWQAALTLKQADPLAVHGLREEAHKAFRDANPGPSHFPTPTQISATQFRRPYIREGHAAPSPGHDAPHSAKVPEPGGIAASDYNRPYISAGHAADAPGNTHRNPPMAAPAATGQPTTTPAQEFMRASASEGPAHALRVLHDHIAQNFASLCPMSHHDTEGVAHPPQATGHKNKAAKPARKPAKKTAKKAAGKRRKLEEKVLKGELTIQQVRARLGLPSEQATPGPVGPELVKSAVDDATSPLRQRLARQKKAIRKQNAALRKQDKTLRKQRKALAAASQAAAAPEETADEIIKAAMEQAALPLQQRVSEQDKMLRKQAKAMRRQQKVLAAIGDLASAPGEPEAGMRSAVAEAAIRSAVEQANAPLLAKMRKQDRELRRLHKAARATAKTADAIARQPDTTGAPFRGVALNKLSRAPEEPVSLAKSAEQAQAGMLANLLDSWRNSPDPAVRMAAQQELFSRTLDPNLTRPQT